MPTLLLAANNYILDDEAEVNPVNVAVLAVAVIAVVAAAAYFLPGAGASGGGGAATGGSGAALASRTTYASIMAAMGVVDEAVAADIDPCSCEPVKMCPHRGGHAGHNACADLFNAPEYQGCDVYVEGKNFDALSPDRVLWEIKVNRFTYYPASLKALVLAKHVAEYQADKQKAFACELPFLFGVSDPQHQAGMIGFGALDTVLNGCP